jgi:methylenetetrahydrofolate reductase (NADPH)
VLPLHSYAQFRRFRAQRELAGMDALDAQLRQVSTADDVAVRGVATKFIAGIVRTLMRSGVRGVYFVTQNLIAPTRAVLQELDLLGGSSLAPAVAAPERPLPWRTSGDRAEMARPIYWSARPQSYIHRTAAARRAGEGCAPAGGGAAARDEREEVEDVDEGSAHPNGRWGSAHSAAFHQDKHNYLLINAAARKCAAFRDVRTFGDVCWAFVAFLNGQGSLPWCAEGLAPEASHILQSVLIPMNCKGLLTINSQPAVNGARSDDPEVGWGPRGGRVYQRQYLEFFCSPAALNVALQLFDEHPSLTYMAQNRERKGRRTNMPDGDAWVRARPASDDQLLQHVTSSNGSGAGTNGAAPLATPHQPAAARFAGMEAVVTWGVFPNRDILQPTTVSSDAFDIWVPEAFEQWLLSFAEGHVPRVVHDIVDTWYLVTVFDNDFTTAPHTAMNTAIQQLLQRLPNLCERERVPTSASDEDMLAFSGNTLQRPSLIV